MDDGSKLLGSHIRVINAMSEMVTATVAGHPYNGRAMDDLDRAEMRLLVCALLGMIETLDEAADEARAVGFVRTLALSANRGAYCD